MQLTICEYDDANGGWVPSEEFGPTVTLDEFCEANADSFDREEIERSLRENGEYRFCAALQAMKLAPGATPQVTPED